MYFIIKEKIIQKNDRYLQIYIVILLFELFKFQVKNIELNNFYVFFLFFKVKRHALKKKKKKESDYF